MAQCRDDPFLLMIAFGRHKCVHNMGGQIDRKSNGHYNGNHRNTGKFETNLFGELGGLTHPNSHPKMSYNQKRR